MSQSKKQIITLGAVILFIMLCVFLPLLMAALEEKNLLGEVQEADLPEKSKGYRYELSAEEKLVIFSKGRENRAEYQLYNSQSLMNEYMRMQQSKSYGKNENYPYLLLENENISNNTMLTEEMAAVRCEEELEALIGQLPIPEPAVSFEEYNANAFTIINIENASKTVAVWELDNGENGGPDFWQFDIDGKSGKIYNFCISYPEPLEWEALDVDGIAKGFCSYFGIAEPVVYEQEELWEKTDEVKKYKINTKEGEVVLTIGLDPVNNSLFLRIP